MILNSVQNGPLIWPTVTETDGTTRIKKHEELSATEKIQANCYCKATNIVLQGLVVYVFNQEDDPIACLNKAMAFLTVVASSKFPLTNNQLRTSFNPRNQATIQDSRVTVQQVHRRQGQSYAGNSYKGNATSSGGNNTGGHARVVKCYNCQEKEYKYIDKEIDLEKKIRELDNIVYKVGQSAQTVHMLTKQQVFYDNAHKKALGYQNLFYLKKAQQVKPTLYVGSVISDKHVASPVFDDEETLILEEVSRSKMLAKQNDPISKEKKVNITPINYAELNRLSEDFGKRFVPQQELFDEQTFWLQTSHPNTDQSDSSLVKIKAPRELPKVSLVNTSLKKLKYHLGQFDTVVKKRITPNALTEGKWGFKHTKDVFLNEIIPFLKTLKDIFNVFDKDLLNEDSLSNNQNALKIPEYFKNNDLKAQLQAKDTTIWKEVKNVAQIPIATTVAPGMFKLDLDPLAPRFTSNNIVPLKKTTYNSVETPKPEIKLYSRRPKQIKSVGLSKEAKIVESKLPKNSEPNHLWGSNDTDVPSSSTLVNDRYRYAVSFLMDMAYWSLE
uniref:Retrovirus-related Pol polyprotein from transposon TNT 1-94 n=1 Tax=Tanacetum cinerariifolium TaxID=118510 RepID=A0A6L2K7A9_TANCI|nr:hypothetical protein [Tanacetum cinerariifolium]